MAGTDASAVAAPPAAVPTFSTQSIASKGFLFADRGEFVAKGFEDPVRLYEVRWRGAD